MDVAGRKLKVFFLEDNPDDVELELHEIVKAGFDVVYDVARNRKEFFEKITGCSADIILADYSLPDITGTEAITLCHELKVEIPVLLLTGEGNEQIAVDSLRQGAIDYILKRNIAGLPARISRAMEIWADRQARKRAEAEEKRLQRLLFETQKVEAIGRLAGGIAHDFNNILTGLMGYLELCTDEITEDSPLFWKLDAMKMLTERGAELVRQLLIFSQRMPLEFKTLDLNALVVETMQFLNRLVEESVEKKMELGGNPLLIRGDKAQLTQVIMNLVLNARDAMNGKGLLTIKTGTVAKKLGSTSETWENINSCAFLTITDTGSGIDESTIRMIFDPFFTTKDVGKGTGLGLSIVYSVVSAHAGTIDVSSTAGRGTSFTVYLPVAPTGVDDRHNRPDIITPRMNAGMLGGNETALIAEDDSHIRELMVSVLRPYGYNLIVAKDGAEALQYYKDHSQKVDVVISDMKMPVKGGIELFRELKTINPNVKFILMTGYSLDNQDERILQQIDDIIRKPFTPMTVMKSMRKVLDKK